MQNPTSKKLKLFVPESLLSRLMDDEALVKEVLDACLPDLLNYLERFRKQLSEGDLDEARRSVHSIKGSAKNSDLRALASVASEIEDALAAGNEDVAWAKEGELAEVMRESIRAVEGYFPGTAG